MYKAFLSLRYLRTRYIALASIVSVMLGVATMIVVNSVMKGFTSEMRSRIQGLLSDIIIETNSLSGQEDAQAHFERVRSVAGDKIAGMTATVEVWGLMTFPVGAQYTTRPITLIGIVPDEKAKVGPLTQYLENYHPLLDGKRFVRPPLHSPKELPNWDLSAEAMAWRKQLVANRNLARDRFDQGGFDELLNDRKSGRVVTPVAHSDTGSSNESHTKPKDASKSPPTSQSGSSANPYDSPNPNPSTPSGDAPEPNVFLDPKVVGPSPQAPIKPVDDAAPQSARVYVGAGLIRYPSQDPKTGESHTVELVHCGEDIAISTMTAQRSPTPVSFQATVVDVFKCGMSEYDSNLVFCNLEALQKFRLMFDLEHPEDSSRKAITSIQIKLKDFADAKEVIERLKAVFPPGIYTVKTWEQKQGPLLAAVEIETGILNVLLFLIIAVAGFGILAIFYMIVVEKTRDIGVLKALGASSGGVMSIFLSYGLALGVVGSGVGVLIGLAFVRYINEIESAIATVTGRKVFDDKVYYFPRIPTLVESQMLFWVTLGAITIAVLASVLPARRAARLRPVEALRYE